MKIKKFNKSKSKQNNKFKTRKEIRKEKRIQQKQNKKENYEKYKLKKKNKKSSFKKNEKVANDDEDIPSNDEEILSDFLSGDEGDDVPSVENKVESKSFKSTKELLFEKEYEDKMKLEKEMQATRKKQLKIANEDEDKVIKNLEKKLGLDKSKSKKSIPKMFHDGLDSLLELCFNKDDNEDEEYLSEKKRKRESETNSNKKCKDDDDFDDFSGESDEEEMFDEENPDEGDFSENSSEEENSSNEEIEEKKPTGPVTDIYGRIRDESGNIVEETKGKYIPPHLKYKLSEENEKIVRLKRILKGNINRLAESNLPKIAKEIDGLYMENSRNDMNSTLTILIVEALGSHVLSIERSVLEHMLLLSVLHANVGSEVGAHFLEVIVKKFNEKLINISKENIENKSLDNIIQMICHLYTFKVVHTNLIYEILDKFVEILNEKAVECILVVLRLIGFTLRKDNPLTLKEFILKIQTKVNEKLNKVEDSSRLKYMLDILLAIKNNNMKKIPQYDPTLAEHFKKQLKALCLNGKYVATLNISLSDLLNAEEHGKWWIVGSAWTGSETIQKQQLKEKSEYNSSGQSFSQQLLELAKAQRMNTDEKKAIFCTIMGSDDYMDAFQKLLRLDIKDNNLLSSIIIQCSISEKDYNPYYSVLAQKFCDHNRKYQLAMKFACWDKIRNIENFTQFQLNNFSKFLIYLIQEGGLAISVLKIIEFNELNKTTFKLMKKVMIGLLLSSDEQFSKIFQKVMKSIQLNSFKDSIRLFMQHFLKRKQLKNLNEHELNLLNKRIAEADIILARSKIDYSDVYD